MYKRISIHVFIYTYMPYTWSCIKNMFMHVYQDFKSTCIYAPIMQVKKKVFWWLWEYLQDLPTFPQFHPLQVFRLLLPAYDGEVYAVRISNFNMKLDM